MTKTGLLFAVAALFAGMAFAAERHSIIKVTHMSTTEVGIACLNGADPTGTKIGDTVIMSCGREDGR